MTRRVYVLLTWEQGRVSTRHYEDHTEAMEVYREAVGRDHAYLYEMDEDGNHNIILELDSVSRHA